ncbi:2-amino-4-hydroxy-6-hydroxymethyldihydropteridine diphosphokinase [Hoylesella saccharolytica]|uniref:2-amino-4-hydroxy-6- hydroxymethyldihydropteridine diphosphokinase n=1 Tax=Hoylesella saccharolytica TaxID=633701 RepID=UPI0028D5131E|nr:2-amino-4-hydroxy-6-hydroxymethyldihydropteridine diphosphokinase [Hoylesella saccharolytica]
MHTVYLGLGANIGNRKRTIEQAIEHINSSIGSVIRRSSLYETQPWGFSSPNLFINAAVCCCTELSPHQILFSIQKIEKSLGRVSKTKDGVYHDRIIDIDILLYDDLTISESNLKIPHPLMYERDFVMKPLNEILE